MKKILVVMLFLVLVGMLLGASNVYRHWSIGDPMLWALEVWVPGVGWVYHAPVTVPLGNFFDVTMGGPGKTLPWEKLYDMPGARWISYDASALSVFSGCVPFPPLQCLHRYTLYQFVIPDTITRATAWLSVGDHVAAIDMRNLRTGVATRAPMPVAGFSGFTQLHRLDLTDFFRDDLTPDAYQMEIYIFDIFPPHTGLIFYLSFDEDDEVDTYTYEFDNGPNWLSFPFYYEGVAGATIATIFGAADSVEWTVPGSPPSVNAPGAVDLDGAYGDTIRTYTVKIYFPDPPAGPFDYDVVGTSIWEKRYLDINSDDYLYFSSVDCVIPWPDTDSPDDIPEGTITRDNTEHARYDAWSSPTRSVIPQNGYRSEPDVTTDRPYHLDIICPGMCCGSPAPGVINERISYPTPEATWARIRSVMALVHVPDSSEIEAYLDSLDSLVKVYSADTIDTFRSSPKKTIEIPKSIVLNVYPNPFNAVVSIVLSLPNEKIVHLSIYDLKGKVVECLSDGKLSTGNHVFTWDGSAVLDKESTSGVFFVKAIVDEEVITKKIQLVK